MLKEFRDFIAKGNLVEIAVAFILGLAFAAVVTAFTQIVLGTIAYVFGSSVSFNDWGVHNDQGALVIPIGVFLTALLNFVIVAFVLFLVVKAYNRFREQPAAGPTEIELLTQIRDELARR